MIRNFAASITALSFVSMLATAASAQQAGKDVAAGTLINRSNIDSLKQATFEGKRIGDMIIERQEWLIRNHGARITLTNTLSDIQDLRIAEATKKYAPDVKLDPKTYQVSGYKAGVPFPDIDARDPSAGVKVVWNLVYGGQTGDNFFNAIAFAFIDGKTGFERVQHWGFYRYHMIRRAALDPKPIEGDGTVFHRTMLFAQYPQDIKGLGTFAIRYTDPKYDDIWAYIRSLRRVRRLSGGAWVDTIGGTDELQDDIYLFNAHPSWYTSFKLLGKRWVLIPTHTKHPGFLGEGLKPEDFPGLDTQNPPYWNRIDDYEPRQAYAIECVPPTYHPYSRKIIYVGDAAALWQPFYMESYDKKGDFWKWVDVGFTPKDEMDGVKDANGKPFQIAAPGWAGFYDFQRYHATILGLDKQRINDPGRSADDYSIMQLEAAGR